MTVRTGGRMRFVLGGILPYQRRWLRPDVIAGVSARAVVIPKAVSALSGQRVDMKTATVAVLEFLEWPSPGNTVGTSRRRLSTPRLHLSSVRVGR